MVPLSLAGGTSQAAIQLSLTVLMFSIMVLMMVTTWMRAEQAAYAKERHLPHVPGTNHTAPHFIYPVFADAKFFGQLFTTAIFSLMLQQGTPMFLHRMPDKRKASRIFAASICVIVLFYLLLCACTVLYFGPNTANPVTLNWVLDVGAHHPTWYKTLCYTVVIFPGTIIF